MQKTDIYLGIGANLTPDGFESPQAGCEAALDALPAYDIDVQKISRWFESAPVPRRLHAGLAQLFALARVTQRLQLAGLALILTSAPAP